MKRQDKYPETSTFHYHNANPKNRITTDCVIRAISTATKIPYTQVVMEMAEMQCKTGYDDGDAKLYDKYLQSKGWVKHKQPRKLDNTKYTGEEFCKKARRYENYIANIGGHHVVAIVNAKVWDIWDSTDGCIGNYWTKG
jgi:hypothetical protein